MQVPQIDFSNATQWVQQASAVVGATTITEGTIAIRQISMATAVGGQILPIPSSYAPNGTYILNFHGPALKCYNASADVQDAFTYGYEKGISANPLFYVYTSTVDLPSMVEPTGDSKQFPNYLDFTSLDHSRIYIRTQNPPLRAAKHTFSVTECGLYNAAYSVEFAFQGSSQKISVLDVRHLDGVSYLQGDAQLFDSSAPPDFDTFLGHWNRGGSYCGLMAGLASVLVGSLAYLPDEEIFSQEFTSIELLDFNYAALPASILQGNVVELFQNITISMLSRPDFQ